MTAIDKLVSNVFKEGSDKFHDTVFEVTGQSLNEQELRELFERLPVHITGVGMAWGLSDTVFNDAVYHFLEENK